MRNEVPQFRWLVDPPTRIEDTAGHYARKKVLPSEMSVWELKATFKPIRLDYVDFDVSLSLAHIFCSGAQSNQSDGVASVLLPGVFDLLFPFRLLLMMHLHLLMSPQKPHLELSMHISHPPPLILVCLCCVHSVGQLLIA